MGQGIIIDSLPKPRRKRPSLRQISRILVVVVVVWAVVATVELVSTSNQQTVQAWNADSGFLNQIGNEFAGASGALQNALTWRNLSWGWEAFGSFVNAQKLATGGGGAPNGPALAAELNLSQRNFECADYGLINAFDWIDSGQSTWTSWASFLENMSRVWADLSTRLSNVSASGSDPLRQLGPDSVAGVQADAGRLYTLVLMNFQAPLC